TTWVGVSLITVPLITLSSLTASSVSAVKLSRAAAKSSLAGFSSRSAADALAFTSWVTLSDGVSVTGDSSSWVGVAVSSNKVDSLSACWSHLRCGRIRAAQPNCWYGSKVMVSLFRRTGLNNFQRPYQLGANPRPMELLDYSNRQQTVSNTV